MIPIEIALKEGPVIIPTLSGSGVDATYHLWNEKTVSEFFPASPGSAFYVLSLKKSVGNPDQVLEVETELIEALQLLSAAWPFCGGSFMVLENREVISDTRFQSNASNIRDQLFARAGKKSVQSSATIPIEAGATYRFAPLKNAAIITNFAATNHGLRRLLRYHQTAWVGYYHVRRNDKTSWFIDLYKVRDFLEKIYKKQGGAQKQLSISKKDWSFFGAILNENDLRHAEVRGIVPNVSTEDVARLYKHVRQWTARYLKTFNLPVIDELP